MPPACVAALRCRYDTVIDDIRPRAAETEPVAVETPSASPIFVGITGIEVTVGFAAVRGRYTVASALQKPTWPLRPRRSGLGRFAAWFAIRAFVLTMARPSPWSFTI